MNLQTAAESLKILLLFGLLVLCGLEVEPAPPALAVGALLDESPAACAEPSLCLAAALLETSP